MTFNSENRYSLSLIMEWDANTLRLDSKGALLLRIVQGVTYELIETQDRLNDLILRVSKIEDKADEVSQQEAEEYLKQLIKKGKS